MFGGLLLGVERLRRFVNRAVDGIVGHNVERAAFDYAASAQKAIPARGFVFLLASEKIQKPHCWFPYGLPGGAAVRVAGFSTSEAFMITPSRTIKSSSVFRIPSSPGKRSS